VAVESSSLLTKLARLSNLRRIFIFILIFASTKVLSETTTGFQEGKVLCVFRNITGMPCPFCGGTRSVGSILRGDLGEAWNFNPLGFAAILILCLALLRPNLLKRVDDFLAQKWWGISHRVQVFVIIGLNTGAWLLNLPRMI